MISVLPANDEMKQMAYMLPPVVYSSPGGKDLHMAILHPWPSEISEDSEKERYPLIIFIQGSAFRFPDIYRKIPQLSVLARAGYVIATVEHRSSLDGNPYPAFLQDVKTAVRFLRAHAQEYQIDPERIAAWGSSSGGTAALLLGFTENDPKYRTEEYASFSDHVDAVVDCFGPADLSDKLAAAIKGDQFPYSDSISMLSGDQSPEQMELLKELSPIYHIMNRYSSEADRKNLPPTFILHGDQDPTVPFSQSKQLYEQMLSAGADVSLLRVAGGFHERNFWSEEVLEAIRQFLDAHL